MNTTDQADPQQAIANYLSAMYDPADPEWTAGVLDYVASHLDDPSLLTTLRAGCEYNQTLLEPMDDLKAVRQ